MDAILFRTHVFNKKIIQNIKLLNVLVGNVFVIYDSTDRDPFPEIGVPVFSFSIDDYEKTGYQLATLEQLYELPTAPALGNRSGAIYFNPEYAQIMAMKWLDEQGLTFDNYWYWEYDVIFNGNPRAFFHSFKDNDTDLLTTMIRVFPHSPTFDKFWNMLNFDLDENQQIAMFGPLWRASRKLLETLDKEYKSGKHGFYETIVPTLTAMNDHSIADINSCGIFYNPLTFNGKGITHYWSQEFVSNMKNMLFHPVQQMPTTLLFATGYLKNQEHFNRYKKWIKYYWEKSESLGVKNILIIDDGSSIEKVQEFKAQIEKEIPFEIYDYDELPDELINGVSWIRFPDNLGRPNIHTTAGWFRSFSYSGVIAEKYEYDKVIHIESDTFVITQRLLDYLRDLEKDWTVLFSKKYNFPETCIQVITRKHFKDLRLLYDLGKDYWFKAQTNTWFIAEFIFKFTNVVKCFIGDRYGEDWCFEIPEDADYVANFAESAYDGSLHTNYKDKFQWLQDKLDGKKTIINDNIFQSKTEYQKSHNENEGLTAFHSGDMGDIIYSIPTLRALKIGKIILNPKPSFGTKMNEELIMAIKPFLESQGFVIEISNGEVPDFDYNMDKFRTIGQDINFTHLSLSQSKAQNIEVDLSQQYIYLYEYKKVAKVIINRSLRYHNNHFNWKVFLDELAPGECAFVGLEDEYSEFVERTGFKCPYYPTKDLYELAKVIGACNLFIGNQSTPFAIAEGFKVNRILEVDLGTPNSTPQTSNGIAVFGDGIYSYAKACLKIWKENHA